MKLSRLEVLSEAEISAIHQSSADVLWKVGILVRSDSVLRMLKEAGCTVDVASKVARIPQDVLEAGVKRAPSNVALYDRELKTSLDHGGSNTFAWSGNVGTFVLTSRSGERRSANIEDVGRFARVADALENIHVVGVQVVPQDVKGPLGEIMSTRQMFANTSKHIFVCHSDPSVARTQFEMTRAVLGGKRLDRFPILTSLVDPESPLTWSQGPVETLVDDAVAGVPCIVASAPTSGGTVPISLAGTLVVQNAEILSGMLISQLANPGAPVIYGTASLIMDMREGRALIGTPETVALRIAIAQLGRFYNLPTQSIGPDSDSHCLDQQNAWESAITAAAAISSQANILMDAGMFAAGLTVSYEQLVIDNEILGSLFHLRRGIEVTRETLATKQIEQVGQSGNYLRSDLQFATQRLKAEYWTSELSCRLAYGKWIRNGAKDATTTAREKADELLENHKPVELDKDTTKALDQIVENFKGKL